MKKTLIETFSRRQTLVFASFFILILLILLVGFFFKSNFEITSLNTNLTEQSLAFLSTVEDGDVISINLSKESDLKLDVAKSQKAKEKGLQFRETLNSQEGMIFIWENEEIRSFWMKNTLIPLDIIFLDKNFKIVKIHKNTKIEQTNEIYTSVFPAKYVIELNAFKSEELALRENEYFPLLALK